MCRLNDKRVLSCEHMQQTQEALSTVCEVHERQRTCNGVASHATYAKNDSLQCRLLPKWHEVVVNHGLEPGWMPLADIVDQSAGCTSQGRTVWAMPAQWVCFDGFDSRLHMRSHPKSHRLLHCASRIG